jgi:hypothetical protein
LSAGLLRPTHLYQKLGASAFWANRGKRIAIPLIAGWVVLFPLISYLWITGVTKVFGGTPPPMPEMPKTPGAFPLTHLWFLYQLLLTYVAFLAVRAIVARLDPAQKLRNVIDKAVTFSIRSMTGMFVLGLPLAAALMSLGFWFYWQGIPTPDQSLIPRCPHPWVLERPSSSGGSCIVRATRSRQSRSAGSRILSSASLPQAGCCTRCTRRPWPRRA